MQPRNVLYVMDERRWLGRTEVVFDEDEEKERSINSHVRGLIRS